MVRLPTARADVLKVAIPPVSVPVPIGLAPSRNVTVPVGVPAPGATAETVAVNVTDWPKTDGFCDEVTSVAVLALFTTCGLPVSERVLPVKFGSQAEFVVMVWLPPASAEVVSVATPPHRVPVPIGQPS